MRTLIRVLGKATDKGYLQERVRSLVRIVKTRKRILHEILRLPIALVCLSLVGFAGDARQELSELVRAITPSGLKILIVGIDGATFDIIHPLIAQGRLPQTKKLMEGGSYGVLESVDPMRSPALWTTIITGKHRMAHAIKGFEVRDNSTQETVLVNSDHRKSLALWNIVTAFDRTVGFIGWWASWPAETVNGYIISDRIPRTRWIEWAGGQQHEHLTYPEGLYEEIQGLIVDPGNPDMEGISSLVRLSDSEKEEFLAVEKPIYAHWLSVFKFAYHSQRTYENIALHMLDKGQPDLIGLYLIAVDPISHTFWHFYEPDRFPSAGNPEDAERLGALIPNMYEHNDRFLANVVSKIDEKNTVLLIVSDHGFEASGALPIKKGNNHPYEAPEDTALKNRQVAVGQSGKHHLDGVLIACGSAIKAGVQIKASVYDITPTVLALMGLPVGRDMRGRVLMEIFRPEFLRKHPVQYVSRYSDFIDREKPRKIKTPSDKEIEEMLKSLGYI